jgi:hypothetical protein
MNDVIWVDHPLHPERFFGSDTLMWGYAHVSHSVKWINLRAFHLHVRCERAAITCWKPRMSTKVHFLYRYCFAVLVVRLCATLPMRRANRPRSGRSTFGLAVSGLHFSKQEYARRSKLLAVAPSRSRRGCGPATVLHPLRYGSLAFSTPSMAAVFFFS